MDIHECLRNLRKSNARNLGRVRSIVIDPEMYDRLKAYAYEQDELLGAEVFMYDDSLYVGRVLIQPRAV